MIPLFRFSCSYMNQEAESFIDKNCTWNKLPNNVKLSFGNSHREWEKAVLEFNIKNQRRWKSSIVRHVQKDEKRYYQDLIEFSRTHLMLYPYHLSDVMVKGLRVTPFAYYTRMMEHVMDLERSYDCLPNFTAADGLRLLGIGRNQYIDMMNQSRNKRFFRRVPPSTLLPSKPVPLAIVERYWTAHIGLVTEDDIKMCSTEEKALIDLLIDTGGTRLGTVDRNVALSLYSRGLIYLLVPVNDDDLISVPPLENFVMNRVIGDYFETLLYKIFVSIDEHTKVADLAAILEIDLELVKNAISMYIRLGFAKKKNVGKMEVHDSWGSNVPEKGALLDDMSDFAAPLEREASNDIFDSKDPPVIDKIALLKQPSVEGYTKRIAFLFDSTLTAFLMMGNLSPGLKTHAVTMFEVGKLSDESLDSLLTELDKITGYTAEGEAKRYFDHALTLRDTIQFLRYNAKVDPHGVGVGVDLIRCESLNSLDTPTCSRVLNKNYHLLISMAPLSNEVRTVSDNSPYHLGPPVPEVNSVWFKLWIYKVSGCGPVSFLFAKGTRLHHLPPELYPYQRLMITTWGHESTIVNTSNVLMALNEALTHSPVLLQAYSRHSNAEIVYVTFPLEVNGEADGEDDNTTLSLHRHPAVEKLAQSVDLTHSCGYITFLNTLTCTSDRQDESPPLPAGSVEVESYEDWSLLDLYFGLPLFSATVNQHTSRLLLEHGLTAEENLEELKRNNTLLVSSLMGFIAESQVVPGPDDEENGASAASPDPFLCQMTPGQTEVPVPLPTRNLFFDGSELRELFV